MRESAGWRWKTDAVFLGSKGGRAAAVKHKFKKFRCKRSLV